MQRNHSSVQGFTLAELLIVVAIIAVLSSIVMLSLKATEVTAKEKMLRTNLELFREALAAYKEDHGYFPCAPEEYADKDTVTCGCSKKKKNEGGGDYNTSGNVTIFKRQLLWYTNENGQPQPTKDKEFRFGPYLQKFPENPFYKGSDKSKMTDVVIELTKAQVLEYLQNQVLTGNAQYGWYYEGRSGLVVPNLGDDSFPEDYVRY